MTDLYPATEPHARGMLEVGDGNAIYWEVCGNPSGKPALAVHGGPGSGCSPGWRRYFDPSVYRLVLFDQRGCGRSTPHASRAGIDLSSNTTGHLLADIEHLRRHLAIERWLVFGGSWGSTLSLAYAEAHPERVSEMILFSIALTSRRDVEWLTRDVGRLFPAEWARFVEGVAASERDGNLAAAYSRLLHDADPAVRERAARNWCAWEDAHVAVHADQKPDPRYEDPAFRLGFARLVTHYWSHAAWLADGALLRGAAKLANTPGVLIHGRLDVSSPLDNAWLLNRAWPNSELVVVDDAGHGTGDGIMKAALLAATQRFDVESRERARAPAAGTP